MMRLISLVALFTASVARSDDKKDWVDLGGTDLGQHWTTKGNWMLKDGVFTLTPRPGEKGWSRFDAYLWSKIKTYQNFDCEFEYKVEAKGNSGFYFHVGDLANPVNQGIEVQIHDMNDPAAKLTDHTSGGVIPGIAPKKQTSKPAGEWNKFLISVKGEKLTITLNGELVNEVDLNAGKLKDRPKTGAIGFQDHGLPLELRNIKIREIK